MTPQKAKRSSPSPLVQKALTMLLQPPMVLQPLLKKLMPTVALPLHLCCIIHAWCHLPPCCLSISDEDMVVKQVFARLWLFQASAGEDWIVLCHNHGQLSIHVLANHDSISSTFAHFLLTIVLSIVLHCIFAIRFTPFCLIQLFPSKFVRDNKSSIILHTQPSPTIHQSTYPQWVQDNSAKARINMIWKADRPQSRKGFVKLDLQLQLGGCNPSDNPP